MGSASLFIIGSRNISDWAKLTLLVGAKRSHKEQGISNDSLIYSTLTWGWPVHPFCFLHAEHQARKLVHCQYYKNVVKFTIIYILKNLSKLSFFFWWLSWGSNPWPKRSKAIITPQVYRFLQKCNTTIEYKYTYYYERKTKNGLRQAPHSV